MILSSAMTERKDKDMTDSMEKLAGVTPDMEEGFQKLKEIFDKEVFELYIRQGQGYVPYMMNDALECYLVLTDCRCTGEYLTGYESCTVGYLSFKEEEKVSGGTSGRRKYFYPLVSGNPGKTGRIPIPSDRTFLAEGKGVRSSGGSWSICWEQSMINMSILGKPCVPQGNRN